VEIQKNTRPYFPQLDGVRAIAALMVMGFHFCQLKSIGGVAILGQTGVDLFFVLSGFLITTILLLGQQNDWHEVRTFYIRRTLRIFPLYYGYLIGASLLGQKISLCFWVYLENIFIAIRPAVAGPNHFWSLAVEEQFYLVWPFLVLFLPRRWLMTTLIMLIGISELSHSLLGHIHVDAFYFTASRLDGLAAGAAIALSLQKGALEARSNWMLGIAGLSIILSIAHWWKFQSYSHGTITLLYASSIGYLVSSGPTALCRILSLRPLRFVGRISYGLYVFHPALFLFVLTRTRSRQLPLQIAECVVATFIVSLVSWYGFEKPFLQLKDRLAPERVKFGGTPLDG
jgi:peptidoglycan/LPS O-acetylase OafA/YrhL